MLENEKGMYPKRKMVNGTAQTVGKQLKVKASQRRNCSGTF